jgi:flagellar biosynthesis protein FlhB
VVLLLSILDFAFQRFQHERDLRMSAREVREELKSTEGDPRVRARIRAVQREMAARRMMEAVKKASVVVTNPTHYAVALRYERDTVGDGGDGKSGAPRASAPVVVGKGADLVALRIRKVAAESGVPLYEDPPLARTLYAKVEIGSEIPLELYEAVARVLAYVYRVQGVAAHA